MKPRSHAVRRTGSKLPYRAPLLLLLSMWAGESMYAQPAAPAGAAPTTPFRYGRILVHPRLTYGYSYSEGILVAPGQPENTEQSSFSPGVLIALGDRWRLDYNASTSHQSNSAFRDAWAHAVQFDGAIVGRDWSLNLGQSYTSSVSTLIETGRETAQQTASSTLGIQRPLSSEVALQGSFDLNFRFVETLPDSYGVSTTQAVSYRVSPRMDVGLGVVAGYNAMYKAADSVSVGPMLQFGWKLGEKFNFSANGGYQAQILLSEEGGTTDSPVYGASLGYNPFEFTTLSISGTESLTNSYFADQFSKSRGWTGSISQRVLKHFSVSISGARQTANYVTVSPDDETIRRSDRLNSFDIRVSTSLLKRGSLSFSYGETRNRSSDTGFTVSSRQMGVQAGFSY